MESHSSQARMRCHHGRLEGVLWACRESGKRLWDGQGGVTGS